jgi:hypothetical protein
MIYKIIYALIISTSLNTLLIITPITLGLNILLISIITSILFAYSNSSWIAFMIFLIYIRGTLVIFSYFLAITPNSSLSSPIHLPLILITPPLIFSILSTINTSTPLSIYTISTNTFYNKSTIISLIIIALILLITIIIVVKIASINKGPLLPLN